MLAGGLNVSSGVVFAGHQDLAWAFAALPVLEAIMVSFWAWTANRQKRQKQALQRAAA
jgi:hypothetical protein